MVLYKNAFSKKHGVILFNVKIKIVYFPDVILFQKNT